MRNVIGGVSSQTSPDTKENNAKMMISSFEVKKGSDLEKHLCRDCHFFVPAPTVPNVGTCPWYKENDEFQLFPSDTWISCLFFRVPKRGA